MPEGRNTISKKQVLWPIAWLGIWAGVAVLGTSSAIACLFLVFAACITDTIVLFKFLYGRVFANQLREGKTSYGIIAAEVAFFQMIIYFISIFYVGIIWLILSQLFHVNTTYFFGEPWYFEPGVISKPELNTILLLLPLFIELVYIIVRGPVGKTRNAIDILLHCWIWFIITGLIALNDASAFASRDIVGYKNPQVPRPPREWYIFFFVLIQWVADRGASIVNWVIKSRPIWPKVSHEVTWFGSLVGISLAVATSLAIAEFVPTMQGDERLWILTGWFIGIFGIIGHVIFAKMKWLAMGDGQLGKGTVKIPFLDMLAGQLMSAISVAILWWHPTTLEASLHSIIP